MPPVNNTFGGGVAETALGTGVLLLMVVAVILVFVLPRKYVLGPLMFGMFLLPVGQALVVGGVHLYVFRVLILAGLIRSIVWRSSGTPLFGGGFNLIDKLFILWAIFRSLAFILQFQEMGAVVNQFGFLWNALGGYFLMRILIRDDDDVRRAIKILSTVAMILAVTMLYEKLRDVNVYSFIAGRTITPEIREGSIRAQGPFHHAILAGTFGATLLPLFFWLWKSKTSRLLGLIGIFASTAITFSAASSTPASAYVAAILAICIWPLRRNMRVIRWGLVVGILMLNFAMHAPVWYVLEHVDLAGGSAGEQRAELIDNFVRHFDDWWLIGTHQNAQWGFEMWDISNQYVAEGETGGLATFICFMAVIVLCFKRIGISRKLVQEDPQKEWYFWLLGAGFFSNIVAFLGISYFDQTQASWYAILAIISVATAPLLAIRATSFAQDSIALASPVVTGPYMASGLPERPMVSSRWKRLNAG